MNKVGMFFTDIHFGRKQNSEQHNQDCIDYVNWFLRQVKSHQPDYIAFLGDWHENRSAINVATLNHSFHCAQAISNIGLPVYFCVGNHDLYQRHTRQFHSVKQFAELDNFTIVNDILVKDDILFSPYLFSEEMIKLPKYDVDFWAGHFSFKGFQMTGGGYLSDHGFEVASVKKQKQVLSGHFHKRQTVSNVTYIGNVFPADFGDVDDVDRGCAILDHKTGKITFINWDDCPKYKKVPLSKLDQSVYDSRTRVKCVVDENITFEDSVMLREKYADAGLREFILEEATKSIVSDSGELEIDEACSIDDAVCAMLQSVSVDGIDPKKLVSVYQQAKVQS